MGSLLWSSFKDSDNDVEESSMLFLGDTDTCLFCPAALCCVVVSGNDAERVSFLA